MIFTRNQNFLALICLLASLMLKGYVSEMDPMYFSPFSDGMSFRKFCPVSWSRCIYECKIRSRCEAINYSEMWKLCSLLNGVLIQPGNEQTGIVGGNKLEWDMVIY